MTEKRKVFLLGFDPVALSREDMTNYLTHSPLVLNWITLLPGQIFLVAQDLSVRDLANAVRERFPDQFVFLSEVSPQLSDGWLPADIWKFISSAPVNEMGRYIRMLSERQTEEHQSS